MDRGRIQGLPKFFGYPLLSQERVQLMDFKFGRHISRAYQNKSPLKIFEKTERGRIQGLPKYFGYPLLSQERVKLRTSNFVGTFIESIGIVAVGVVRQSRKFPGHPYVGRIARSSLR